MNIGTLNKDLKGNIKTLDVSFQLKLIPNKDRRSDNSPTHDVVAVNRMGEVIQLGAAWERKITKGAKENQNMYSLSIDDPAFKTPLNCNAFPSDDGYYITWEREKPAIKEEF